VNLILVVGFIGHAQLRNSISRLYHPFLVAFPAMRDLLLFAKDLFVAAMNGGKRPGWRSKAVNIR
jgi:hypothetical protein